MVLLPRPVYSSAHTFCINWQASTHRPQLMHLFRLSTMSSLESSVGWFLRILSKRTVRKPKFAAKVCSSDRNVGPSLHIVDDGWASPQSTDGRKWRLGCRHTTKSLDGGAIHVGTGISFVGIASNILCITRSLHTSLPLEPSRVKAPKSMGVSKSFSVMMPQFHRAIRIYFWWTCISSVVHAICANLPTSVLPCNHPCFLDTWNSLSGHTFFTTTRT